MGWTYYHENRGTWKNGRFIITPKDRKEICDAMYAWEDERATREVIKSAVVGSTWYGAIRHTDKATGAVRVWAGICKTATNARDWLNFGYKDMDETCGPCEIDCPKSILDLLTDTDREFAIDWRRRCREKLKNKNRAGLNSLPIGSVIECTIGGKPLRLIKHAPGCGLKRSFWWDGSHYRYLSKWIKDYTVVERGVA